MPARTVLVTGASGFMALPVMEALARAGWRVRAAARDPASIPQAPNVEPVALPDLETGGDLAPLTAGAEAVVHLAGIAHQTKDIPEARYRAVNAEAVERLARAAARTGARRLVLMSSVRAQSGPVAAGVIKEDQPARPTDAYGRSKLAGESVLAEALSGTATSHVILRPVLVYGPGIKGNMRTLLRLARLRGPLPLGGLSARRSILDVRNLAQAVVHVLEADPAAGGTFLVADGEALTVPQMIAAMRAGLGRRPGLLTVPLQPLGTLAGLAGKGEAWQRITGELIVSADRLRATGWRPAVAAEEGLAEMARGAERSDRRKDDP